MKIVCVIEWNSIISTKTIYHLNYQDGKLEISKHNVLFHCIADILL